MKNKFIAIKEWIYTHPKPFYKYSMIVILISFLFTILQYIFFPPDFQPKVLVPNLYGKSEQYKTETTLNEKEMGKIVKEMQDIEKKAENETMDSRDSIRLKFLYNQYQKLKNGPKKN